MRISDWSSDVCSSDLLIARFLGPGLGKADARDLWVAIGAAGNVAHIHFVRMHILVAERLRDRLGGGDALVACLVREPRRRGDIADRPQPLDIGAAQAIGLDMAAFGVDFQCLEPRSEEHTSELQSLMRISYAVFCLKKNNT